MSVSLLGREQLVELFEELCKESGLTNEQQALRIRDEVLPGVPVNRQAREALVKVFERDLGSSRTS